MNSESTDWRVSVVSAPQVDVVQGVLSDTGTFVVFVHRRPWVDGFRRLHKDRMFGLSERYACTRELLRAIDSLHTSESFARANVAVSQTSDSAHFIPRFLDDASDADNVEELDRVFATCKTTFDVDSTFAARAGAAPVYTLREDLSVAVLSCIPRYPSRGDKWNEDCRVRTHLVVAGLILAEAHSTFQISDYYSAHIGIPIVTESGSASLFQTIFASYARDDLRVVEAVDSIVNALGVGELRWDLKVFRSGDEWQTRIQGEIVAADTFQLFWSNKARDSKWVEKEWRYALGLDKKGVIRPVYWTEPMTTPPDALSHLHFAKIDLSS